MSGYRYGDCYACAASGDDRIVTRDGDGWRAVFPSRFTGPAGSANGGIVAGMMGCPALDAASRDGGQHVVTRISARLAAPAMVGAELRMTVEDDGGRVGVTLRNGEATVATAAVTLARLDAPPLPGQALPIAPPPQRTDDLAAICALADAAPEGPSAPERIGDANPVPSCFSCGSENARGLRIFPREVSDREVWSRWHPAAEFADAHGGLANTIVGSAIDCSMAYAIGAANTEQGNEAIAYMLLGSIDLHFLRVAPIEIDGDYRIVGRYLSRDGRKIYAMSALLDAAGTPYVTADSVWITVAPR